MLLPILTCVVCDHFLDYFWRLVKNFKEEKSPQAKKSELDLTSAV